MAFYSWSNLVSLSVALVLSSFLGTAFCAPTAALVGGLAAVRFITTNQPVHSTAMMALAGTLGAIGAISNKINGNGLRFGLMAAAALLGIGAFFTMTTSTTTGGSKYVPCPDGYACRSGPRDGASLNSGHCFNKCCGKTTVYSTYSSKPGVRVQWPNCVTGPWYDDGGHPEWVVGSCQDAGAVQVDFGDGCKSVMDLDKGQHNNPKDPAYYDGEYGVDTGKLDRYPKMPVLNNANHLEYGFYDSTDGRAFLEAECGLGEVKKGTDNIRLFAKQTSYSSEGQCGDVPCTGYDPQGDPAIIRWDTSLPYGNSEDEFFVNPDHGPCGHCCSGFEPTPYGTCKKMASLLVT